MNRKERGCFEYAQWRRRVNKEGGGESKEERKKGLRERLSVDCRYLHGRGPGVEFDVCGGRAAAGNQLALSNDIASNPLLAAAHNPVLQRLGLTKQLTQVRSHKQAAASLCL